MGVLAAWVVATALLVAASTALAAGPPLPSHDPFYRYGGSLAAIPPGTLLRSRTVNLAENGQSTAMRATQLLYRTTGQLGQPTVTVATVIRPAAATAVTRLVAYQTAYDALGSECDPSYTLRGW